ncbi:MAG: NADH-quinone oxidoreductase subunit M [Verrucomicrobia bacterium]|nr:NADH-quinone oxidoreductase subunit M [Verrucomicrobiota bacterium]
MLAWTMYISFLGVALLLLPAASKALARWVALLTAVAGLSCAVAGAVAFQPDGGIVTLMDVSWIPALGIRFHLAADGISVTLVLLTGLAAVAGVLFSWNVEHRVKEFFAFYLALIGGVYGVFLSADAFLLFAFYEIAIIPKYFLIAIWGSTRKEYGAMKLALYSFVGSGLVLIGLIAAFVVSGAKSFGLVALAQFAYPASFQQWAFPLVFVGFGILAGLWPFHTWAPTGHVAAPTAASMLLAGVVMKLGAYGCLRVAMTLFPQGAREWAWVFGLLAVIGIVTGALAALAQRDFKFVIGYSSVSHMGFVLLGLMTLNATGLNGAVLQMFSHGVIAGLLFAVVGRMVYDRTHTRELPALAGLELNKALPFAAVTFVLAGFAAAGLPGFSGFVAELQVLLGAWRAFPWFVIVSGIGIVIGVAYTLRVMQQAFYGRRLLTPAPSPSDGEERNGTQLEPISLPEKIGAGLLLACTIAIGLYPRVLMDLFEPSVEALAKVWTR